MSESAESRKNLDDYRVVAYGFDFLEEGPDKDKAEQFLREITT